MITESIPLINYPIREPVPSYFSPKPKFLQLEPIMSGSLLTIGPKSLATVLLVVTPLPLHYKYSHKDSDGQVQEEEVAQKPEVRPNTSAKSPLNLLQLFVP